MREMRVRERGVVNGIKGVRGGGKTKRETEKDIAGRGERENEREIE